MSRTAADLHHVSFTPFFVHLLMGDSIVSDKVMHEPLIDCSDYKHQAITADAYN